jgi:multiple sugar transport system permease protein
VAGTKQWQHWLAVLFFLLPNLAGVLLFSMLPVSASLVLTLFKWDLITPAQFVGLDNFRRLLGDADFWEAFRHTMGYLVGYVPLVTASGLFLAVLLNQKLRFTNLYRTAFFLPVVSSWVAVSLLWRWLFNPVTGPINFLLGMIGIQGPAWLYDPNWAMPGIIIASVWKESGFIAVLYLAGLQSVPQEYYEAASIDGAGIWKQFWRITLPLLTPTTFFVVTISMIGAFQVFEQVYIMTEGGPGGATTVLAERIFKHAFRYGRMGYAAAYSWFLFVLIFAVTLIQTRFQRSWVHYE